MLAVGSNKYGYISIVMSVQIGARYEFKECFAPLIYVADFLSYGEY